MFKRHRQRILLTGIFLLLVIGILIIILDWQNTRAVILAAEWQKSGFAFLFVACSYFFLSYGYAIVSRVFDIQLDRINLLYVGFVSTALNNLLDSMGMGGHALRIMLMERRDIPSSKTLAASIFHSHLHNLGMFCVLPIGLIYLVVNRLVPPAGMFWLSVFTAVVIAFIIVATLVVFKQSLRAFCINLLSRLLRFITRRDASSFFTTFDESMTAGVAVLKDKPRTLLLILFCVAAEWAFMLVGFWCCFDALGAPVSPGILITGFSVGISVGNVSMLPGGLGIQEASMAGVYASLGVPFERGVLVSLLFRTVYDFIPFLISLFFYRRLLRMSKPVTLEKV